jgi:hypothetical protein
MGNIIPSSRGIIIVKLAIEERKYPCIIDVNNTPFSCRGA